MRCFVVDRIWLSKALLTVTALVLVASVVSPQRDLALAAGVVGAVALSDPVTVLKGDRFILLATIAIPIADDAAHTVAVVSVGNLLLVAVALVATVG